MAISRLGATRTSRVQAGPTLKPSEGAPASERSTRRGWPWLRTEPAECGYAGAVCERRPSATLACSPLPTVPHCLSSHSPTRSRCRRDPVDPATARINERELSLAQSLCSLFCLPLALSRSTAVHSYLSCSGSRSPYLSFPHSLSHSLSLTSLTLAVPIAFFLSLSPSPCRY